MSFQLVLLTQAEDDLRQAYRWYEENRLGLGDEFLLCIEATLTAIEANPLQFPIIYRE